MRKLLKDINFYNIIGYELVNNEKFELCKGFEHVFMKKGHKVCSAGDKDDKFYIVLRGKVAFSIPRLIKV